MKETLIIAIILLAQFTPSYAADITWSVVEHSTAYSVFRPWEHEVKLAATEALSWEVADYRDTILTYYELLYSAVLHNQIDRASRYLGILLALLLKAKGYTEASGQKLAPLLDTLDWGTIRILDLSPEEIVEQWLLYRPNGTEDFAYAYASVCLSLLEKLPVNSFIRVLNTPGLREEYLLGYGAVLAASTYFVYRRSKLESEKPELEAPP